MAKTREIVCRAPEPATRLTPGFRRALETLAEHGLLDHGRFASLMWPASDRVHNYASHGGPPRAATGLLGKLVKRGWVVQSWDGHWLYEISNHGLDMLDMLEGDEDDR